MGARILAVADFYEAITAKRHYREPMSTEDALQILRSESGSHFEPRIVNAFIDYLNKNTVCPLEDQQGQGLTELKRQPRIDYRTQVSTKIDRRTIAGASVDISMGGLFVNTEAEVEIHPGSTVIITFIPPRESRPVQVPGEIIWVNSGDPRPAKRLPKGFGVRFNQLSSDLQHTLQEYVEFGMRQPSPGLSQSYAVH